ncbi:LA_0442/LA_0875 N-terminal domain-containing protein [Leptospira ainlahdjerensis]|uniref:LA_0442/LA_0875 N-terminal domain-containing protein n=1 Tax=Leptospira ainlahdjerensis TaxID=2810033 RepID=UPI002FCA5AE6
MLKKFTSFSFLIVFLFLFSQSLWSAQTILLKNGTSIKADVTGQNEKNIIVRMTDGTVKTISKKSILKVVYRDVNEEEAKRIRLEEEKKLKEAKSAEEKKQIEEEAIVTKPNFKSHRSGDRNRLSLVWRSAVFPGWGHYKADRKKSAYVYGSLFWTGILATFSSAQKVTQTKADYDQASLNAQILGGDSPFLAGQILTNGKRESYKKAINDYQQISTATAILYLIQLAHVYYTGISWEEEEVALNPQGSILKKGLQMDSMREFNSLESGANSIVGWRAEARYNWFF